MFDREEHREAAQVVSAVLAKHQQTFQELADFKGSAMDQTLAALHAQAYASLFFDLARIPDNETIRPVLKACGVLQVAGTDLRSLRIDVIALLFVSPKRKPIVRKAKTKVVQSASSSISETFIERAGHE